MDVIQVNHFWGGALLDIMAMWLWVKNRYPNWNPWQMETWTKTGCPIPGCFLLTHTHLAVVPFWGR